MARISLTLAVPATAVAGVAPVYQPIARLEGLADPLADRYQGFGYSIATDGNMLVVGAPGTSLGGAGSGAAYVYMRTAGTWIRQARLLPPSPSGALGFGGSVAISGDSIVVGGPRVSSYSENEAAYIFVRGGSTWSIQAVLVASDGTANDSFGSSVAIAGDAVIVGAPTASTPAGNRSGAAYAFLRSGATWSQQQKLLPGNLAARDAFGTAVSLDGQTALIGSSQKDVGGRDYAGSAYVFEQSGSAWTERQALVPAGSSYNDSFGASVSLSGSTAVIGAPNRKTAIHDGSAFVYERSGSTWIEKAELAEPGGPYDTFGASVAVSGSALVVGASGAARSYIFRSTGGVWSLEREISSSYGIQFGKSVAISGNVVAIGDPETDQGGNASVFDFDGNAWIAGEPLQGPGTTAGDAFGSDVVVDGDTLVVRSPWDRTTASASGSVTVFTRSGTTWSVQQKLLCPAGGGFGGSLALSGDVLAVGGPAPPYGAVHVYRRVTGVWSLEQTLSGGQGAYAFGASLAIDGETLLVGDPQGQVDNLQTGLVQIFSHATGSWLLRQSLQRGSPGAGFASSLAISGDLVAVGIPSDVQGSVVLFQRTGETYQRTQALVGPGDDYSGFGRSLRLRGGTLAVGAPETKPGGAVYFYHLEGGSWSLTQKVAPTDARPGWASGGFGWFVDFGDEMLLVGAPSDIAGLYEDGSAYLFRKNGEAWQQEQKLTAPDPVSRQHLGRAGGIAGDQLLVGAPQATTAQGYQSGVVLVFGPGATDLSLSMTASPAAVAQGDLVAFDLTVTNNGPQPATGLQLVVDLEPGLGYDSATTTSGICLPANGAPSCTLGGLAAGASLSTRIVGVAIEAGAVTTTARVLPGATSAQATTIVSASAVAADVSISKFSYYSSLAPGSTAQYGLSVANGGPGMAVGVRITDPAPTGLSFLRNAGTCDGGFPCLIPRLAPGGSAFLVAYYKVPSDYAGPNSIVNTAAVTSVTADPNPSNDLSTTTTPVKFLSFYTVAPCRLIDTRASGGWPGPLPAGSRSYYAARDGVCSIPASARALAVNVTVTQPTHPGNLTLYPTSGPMPPTSFVNYDAGQTRSNNGVLALDLNTRFTMNVQQAAGTVHVIVDVVGYFR